MTFRSLLLCVLGSLFLASPLAAQVPQRRIGRPITNADRIPLPGSRAPLLASATDLGAVPADSTLTGITLVFKSSPEQQSDLQQLLADQQNPDSPQYRQWLTPDAFAARFGMAAADLQSTETWLASQGFRLDPVPPSRDRLSFSGTAAQVATAFGTELHRYRLNGEVHFAPASELSLPGALAPVTAAVLHLSDIRPRPDLKLAARPAPAYNTASGAHALGPTDLKTMYDAQPSPTSTNAGGSNASIAVLGQSYVDINGSINFFISSFGVLLSQFTPVLVPGTGVEGYSIGDESESELDVEYAAGIAPAAKVYLVHVGTSPNHDVFDALSYAVQFNIAPVLSLSYSICEPLLSATELDQFNAVLMQAAAQGQTVIVAAGDSGSTACVNFTAADGVTAAQQTALAVAFPADSPYVTAVGGTQMLAGTFAPGANAYWSAGPGDFLNQTLLSYVPEVVWNEGSPAFGILAGGGGSSTHFARPTWQAGVPGIPAGAFRLLPDISLQASVQSPGFIFCTTDPGVVGTTGESSCNLPLQLSGSKSSIGGGTSFAAPTLAGFIATLNGLQGIQGQGLVNPTLYSLASQPATYASVFHDITAGSIACITGTPNCTSSGQSGFSAGQGFDQASGLGSIDFNNLVAAWPAVKPGSRQPALLLVEGTGADSGAQASESISVGPTTLAPNNPIPTGTISVTLDGNVLASAAAFTGSALGPQATLNFGYTAPSTVGAHVLSISYSGDAVYAPAHAVAVISVGNVEATGGLSLVATNLTLTNGTSGSTQVTITPNNGYNGRILWSLSITANSSTATSLSACYQLASPAVNGITTAALHLGVGAACGASASGNAVLPMRIKAASLQHAPQPPFRGKPLLVTSASLLCLLSLLRRRRRVPLLIVSALFLVAGASALTGCGGGSNQGSSPTPTPTPAPTSSVYTVTLNAHDSVNTSITASTTFTLTVD